MSVKSFYFLANLTNPTNIRTSQQALFETSQPGQHPIQLQILRDTEWNFPLSEYLAQSPNVYQHCLCYYEGDSGLSTQALIHRFRLGDRTNFSIVAEFHLNFMESPLKELVSRYHGLVGHDMLFPQSENVWRDSVKLNSIRENATIHYDVHIYRKSADDHAKENYDALFSTPTISLTSH